MSISHQILDGHTSDVNWVDFTGTKLLVSASNDKTVRLWESDDSGLFKQISLSPLVGHHYGVNCVRFSPFGTIIASGSTDGNIILWNTHTGEQVVKLTHDSGGGIRVCSFSPSSSMLASGGDDESLVIWDISTRSMIRSLADHEAMITACTFSPDSCYLISGSSAGDLKLWDSKYGHAKCLFTTAEAHDLGVLGCDFSSQYEVNVSDGPLQSFYLLASCGNDDLVKLWHVRGGLKSTITLSHSLKGHNGNVNCCRFNTDGSLLASAAGDKLVIIWNPQNGVLVHKLEGHSRYVTSCAFSSDNKYLATGSNDKTVIVWNMSDMKDRDVIITKNGSLDESSAMIASGSNIVSDWTLNDVIVWLERLDLGKYSSVFRENSIDGIELVHLTNDSLLTALKIDSLGHRNKILRGIQALKNPLWQHINDDAEDNSSMPNELCCPITHEIMKEPVVAADGYTYEREAITEWINNGNSTSPMTNEVMINELLLPNLNLKTLIQKYLSK
ncbi:unnamed protein product [Oppiella nova]|uniref:WD repeat, SAM and U-box domain-containing protein 1 n=1 Tax=Oppiella nova TaxID=334625 RepID=A0A7R9QKP2_9ACAR|nr:unnamed protein product [Oppiella nova]CAG2166909.1 unnamed protein product [Oppiella nova]